MTNILDDAQLAIALPGFTTAELSDLTHRERDVIELITNGYSNAEIARLLYLSINSVKTYVRTSYRKIGAETRAHAIVWGVRHDLLPGVVSTPLA